MKVLIISANILPTAPSGPAYVAGAALQAGHEVEVFETLFCDDVIGDLARHLERFDPDVVAISIRVVNGVVVYTREGGRHERFDMRPLVHQIVATVQHHSDAAIVLGGPGFNYYGPQWLDYLGLDYGIRGEAEFSFPIYLDIIERGGDLTRVPGAVYRQDGHIIENARPLIEDMDATALPAYHLFDLPAYAEYGLSPAILTKRGCCFDCTFCPYCVLEGKGYRLKSPVRVVDEIEAIPGARSVTFCDNSFNVPRRHAEAICREMIGRDLEVTWNCGSIKPVLITDEWCQLMWESRCSYVGLAIESASDTMLTAMHRGYKRHHVENALDCFSRAGIPWGVSLMFGAPGETPGTILETLDVIDRYPVPQVWVSIGISLWTPLQRVVAQARREGQLVDDAMLFEGAHYVSPQLPPGFMADLIAMLSEKPGYTVQVNQAHAEYQ